MTYGEFKKQMQAAGVRDDDVIGYIEIDPLIETETAELLINRIPTETGTLVNVIDKLD